MDCKALEARENGNLIIRFLNNLPFYQEKKPTLFAILF